MKKLIVVIAVLLLGMSSSSPQQNLTEAFTSAPQIPITKTVIVFRVSDAYGHVKLIEL